MDAAKGCGWIEKGDLRNAFPSQAHHIVVGAHKAEFVAHHLGSPAAGADLVLQSSDGIAGNIAKINLIGSFVSASSVILGNLHRISKESKAILQIRRQLFQTLVRICLHGNKDLDLGLDRSRGHSLGSLLRVGIPFTLLLTSRKKRQQHQ